MWFSYWGTLHRLKAWRAASRRWTQWLLRFYIDRNFCDHHCRDVEYFEKSTLFRFYWHCLCSIVCHAFAKDIPSSLRLVELAERSYYWTWILPSGCLMPSILLYWSLYSVWQSGHCCCSVSASRWGCFLSLFVCFCEWLLVVMCHVSSRPLSLLHATGQ